jgi:hypothetical protein
MFDVCTTGDTAHIDTTFSSKEYRCTHIDACVAITWIEYRCVPCHSWCTHRTSLVVKKINIPVAVNNSIKVGPMVFLLQIFVITGNIMKRHVFLLYEIIIVFRIMLSYPIRTFHRHGWHVMSYYMSYIPSNTTLFISTPSIHTFFRRHVSAIS